MNGLPDNSFSVTWWQTATIRATVAAAVVQIVSWLFSLFAYYTKELPQNQILAQMNQKINLDRFALILAGVAAVAALAGAIFSIRYANLADRDSLEVHNQLTTAYKESTSASEMAKQALLDLTETRGHLTAVTQQLADAEQQLATARERLQAVERAADLTLLITRMNADDAQAYDSLRIFKGTPAQDASVKAALEAVVQAHRSPYTQHHPQWKHTLSLQEVDNVLSLEVSRPYDRLSALEVLMASPIQKKLFPKLVSMALSDSSLDVRTAATQVLNSWTSNNFRPLDNDQLTLWWETEGKKHYAAP